MHQHLHCRSPIRGRKRERIWENIWRDNSWKLFEHGKGNSEVQEAETVPGRINPRRNTLRHIVIKLAKIKDKDKIFKTRKKRQITYKGTPKRLSADFSTEVLQVWREWHDIFVLKMIKWENLKYRVLYLAKLSLSSDGEITNFTDKQKLRESSSTEAALWQMLKELLKGNRDKEKIYKN